MWLKVVCLGAHFGLQFLYFCKWEVFLIWLLIILVRDDLFWLKVVLRAEEMVEMYCRVVTVVDWVKEFNSF